MLPIVPISIESPPAMGPPMIRRIHRRVSHVTWEESTKRALPFCHQSLFFILPPRLPSDLSNHTRILSPLQAGPACCLVRLLALLAILPPHQDHAPLFLELQQELSIPQHEQLIAPQQLQHVIMLLKLPLLHPRPAPSSLLPHTPIQA